MARRVSTLGFLVLTFHFFLIPIFAVSVSSEELKKALPDEYKTLGPEKFFGIIDLFNSLEAKVTDPPNVCQGRLTLTSNTPITTADVSDATTVYFTPFGGNHITLYNGSRWQLLDFSQVSVAVPATTTTPFDIFGYLNGDNLVLETVDWTNNTTRATALTRQDGVYVKTGELTKRYLGTGRTEADSGQTHDSVRYRFLWNNCNRVPRKLWYEIANNASYGYQSSTWRTLNGGSGEDYYLNVVVGLAESIVDIFLAGASSQDSTSDILQLSIGEDSATTPHSEAIGRIVPTGIIANLEGRTSLRVNPAVGYHSYGWLEKTDDAVANTIIAGTHTACSGTTQCITWSLHGWIDG